MNVPSSLMFTQVPSQFVIFSFNFIFCQTFWHVYRLFNLVITYIGSNFAILENLCERTKSPILEKCLSHSKIQQLKLSNTLFTRGNVIYISFKRNFHELERWRTWNVYEGSKLSRTSFMKAQYCMSVSNKRTIFVCKIVFARLEKTN